MKKVSLIFLMFLLSLALFGQNIMLEGSKNDVRIFNNSESGFNAQLELKEIKSFDVKTEMGSFSRISIPGFTHSNVVGAPQLPEKNEIIAVPLNAKVHIEVIKSNVKEFYLPLNNINYKVLPAQAPQFKSGPKANPDFAYNESEYRKNMYNNKEIVSVTELGILRGLRLMRLNFAPVRYNPSTDMIQVYDNYTISVTFENADYYATNQLRLKTYSPYFEKSYSSRIFNYLPLEDRDELSKYPLKYVIIADDMFQDELQPFIEWKTQQGFTIIEEYTSSVGTSTNDIKSYLQALYNAGTPSDPAPTYVLFVGDTPQIPAWNGQTENGHITDLYSVEFTNDMLPEMYYGRFSARNVSELIPQIEKTLAYEKLEIPSTDYMAEVTLIAGMDGSWAPTHANGQINYGTQQYFNMDHGITSHTYLYPASGSSDAQIIQDVSDGVGFINYTAHGSETSWADPTFTIADINSLQNENEYTFAIGNCCLTNHFNTPECFGEAWLRAENKGAIAYIGGTNSTLWDEDYWWGVGATDDQFIGDGIDYDLTGRGVYDGMFHTHNEPFADFFTTAGQIIMNGNLAVAEAGSSNSAYYWEIYSVMGDPSISPYIGVPVGNPAEYVSSLIIGAPNFSITNAVPYSLISISKNNEILATALADENGNAELDVSAITVPGTVDLVITAQNTEPIITTLDVIPSETAYVVVSDVNFGASNETVLNFGESTQANLNFMNYGNFDAQGMTVTISTEDDYVTVLNNEISIADIEGNGSLMLSDAFEINVSNRVPNGHTITFEFEITDNNNNVWNSSKTITINAPLFDVTNVEFNEVSGNNDGLFDAGETIGFTVTVANNGNAVSEEAIANVVLTSDIISIDTTTFNLAPINSMGSTEFSFEAIISEDAELGELFGMGIVVNSGYYSAQSAYSYSIGVVTEDFESGDFSMYDWTFAGDQDWSIVSDESHNGSYSAKSGTISHNQTSELVLNVQIVAEGELSFYRKVSSESGYDYLKFYIDDEMQDSWSGNEGWAQESYNVAPGNYTIKWVYSKDGSVSNGDDCAWIDDIVFPGIGSVPTLISFVSAEELDFGELVVGQSSELPLVISNIGVEDLDVTLSFPSYIAIENLNERDMSLTIAGNSLATLNVIYTPLTTNDINGNIEITTNDPNNTSLIIPILSSVITSNHDDITIPSVTKLYGNYPNPFNPTTQINFGLAKDDHVSVTVYNLKGQKVQTLIDERLTAGNHVVTWNGDDQNGKQTSSGVYFYKLETSKIKDIKKMIMLK